VTPVEGLGEACGTCGRRSGDHTLDEWAVCMGTMTTNLPFEQVPDDLAQAASAAIRQQFGLDDDLILADSVVVKAATLAGRPGVLDVKVPALIHEFQVAVPGQPPVAVAKVIYVGDVASMRAYGRLARDSANGAANAAERGK